MITTEAMVAELPKDKPAMPMGGGGGGGMGGMDFLICKQRPSSKEWRGDFPAASFHADASVNARFAPRPRE